MGWQQIWQESRRVDQRHAIFDRGWIIVLAAIPFEGQQLWGCMDLKGWAWVLAENQVGLAEKPDWLLFFSWVR